MSSFCEGQNHQDSIGGGLKMIIRVLVLTIILQLNLEHPGEAYTRLKHISLRAIKPHVIHYALRPEKVIW